MKLGILLAALCAFACPVATHAAYIDFESVPKGLKGTSFAIDGATFTTTAPAELLVGNLTTFTNQEICSVIGNGCSGPLGVSFAGPVSNLSFQIDGVGYPSSILTAIVSLSGGGTATYAFTNFKDSPFVLNDISFGSLGGIMGLVLTTDDELGYGYDNFSFRTSSVTNPGGVPEPATWAIFVAGFGLIGLSTRRSLRTSKAFARA